MLLEVCTSQHHQITIKAMHKTRVALGRFELVVPDVGACWCKYNRKAAVHRYSAHPAVNRSCLAYNWMPSLCILKHGGAGSQIFVLTSIASFAHCFNDIV